MVTRLRSSARIAAMLAAVVLLSVGALFALAQPASAHNYLVSSTPSEGETLTELPEQFIITTNDVLLDLGNKGAFAMQVTDAAGLFYGDGCVAVDGPSLSMTPALGASGDYTVVWQAVSADGHTVSGSIPFTWNAAPDFVAAEGSATAPACGAASEPSEAPDDVDPPAQAEDSGSNDVLWIVGAGGAVVIAVAAVLLLGRKRS